MVQSVYVLRQRRKQHILHGGAILQRDSAGWLKVQRKHVILKRLAAVAKQQQLCRPHVTAQAFVRQIR